MAVPERLLGGVPQLSLDLASGRQQVGWKWAPHLSMPDPCVLTWDLGARALGSSISSISVRFAPFVSRLSFRAFRFAPFLLTIEDGSSGFRLGPGVFGGFADLRTGFKSVRSVRVCLRGRFVRWSRIPCRANRGCRRLKLFNVSPKPPDPPSESFSPRSPSVSLSSRDSSRTLMTLNLLFENPQAESVVAKHKRQAWTLPLSSHRSRIAGWPFFVKL